ncbi:hypothetical protein [Nodosilinea sp. P-1105]|uniref:hypothetical protein n=1 Tax=Nodosilinea sp. P-1105 TaxID=2546229 RepID=UPI00146BC136|nr:hypothetical protein [Nodosilinea sp. P-1105]NMF86341.1 hypothetical protein [Nodosilinea sp. P-1105]
MAKILQEGANYTFQNYFELPQDTDEILAEFGYDYVKARLQLPVTQAPIAGLDTLKAQIEETLPYVQITSESAKREVLIAPVLMRVATLSHQVLRFEYPLKVNDWLQGNLDYLIRGHNQVVVVEAKRDDLTRGFTQLAVEMIALATDDTAPALVYGAVTMGNFWVFGRLNRETKRITQDIGGYQVPDDVEILVKTLVGILEQD